MRSLLALLLLVTTLRAAEPPFEIRDGDRVLFLGDVLLERENTYGYLETRMHEQFPDRTFTVRNLSWAGETPLGLSRASFDPPAKGGERLREQIGRVKPTVVFLGFGMAASLQELTDRSQDPTLNRDPARYGAEPMSAARFKKELGALMDAIGQAEGPHTRRDALPRVPDPAVGASPQSEGRAGARPSVRFVLLSPIRHEDLRATRPGLPDPAEHNKLLAEYSKVIEELAKERGARFVDLFNVKRHAINEGVGEKVYLTDNGIHLSRSGSIYLFRNDIGESVEGHSPLLRGSSPGHELTPRGDSEYEKRYAALLAAVLRKNELFFHQFRPANETYIFGFRKHEQGRNAREMPMFDPLIAQAEAEIERLKRAVGPSNAQPRTIQSPAQDRPTTDVGPSNAQPRTIQSSTQDRPTTDVGPSNAQPRTIQSPALENATPSVGAPKSVATAPAPPPLPLPTFTVADGYQIELWAENPLLEKPTQMNWDALGRLWVCSSSLYPMIEPGQPADDKILILSDPERTGKATKSEIFTRGLLIPTGVVPDLGKEGETESKGDKENSARSLSASPTPSLSPSSPYGCYVGQSTELLHFAADGTKRIVLSGFGTEDTHHTIHTLRWGPDGRLYFNQSIYIHSHLETPWGLVRLNSGGCLAYDPRTERVEVFAKGWINSWGHAWDRWGQSFFTDGAGGGGINWAFPGAQFVTYEGARQTIPSVSPGSYPKFCGLEIVYSPHFPADWQGNAVTCDFRAHRIVRFGITDLSEPIRDAGSEIRDKSDAATPHPASRNAHPASATPSSGYTTKEMPDLVRTADLSFRPIDIKLGPDGALYVADWSNPVINHGEVDFRDPRRDKHMGRIWRISKKDAPLVKWEPLVGKKTPELLGRLDYTDSLWEYEQARRVLEQRGQTDVFKAISEAGRKWSDEELLIQLWLHNAMGTLAMDIAIPLAGNRKPGIRAAATRYLGELFQPGPELIKRLDGIGLNDSPERAAARKEPDDPHVSGVIVNSLDSLGQLIADPNPRVRLEAMRALARIPTARSAELVLDAAVGATRRDALPRVPDPGAGAGGGAAAGSVTTTENQGRAGARPSEDVFYNHAAWLSINDLAQPWLDALASGAWKPEGRERQLEFALNALPPDTARGALAKVLGTAPRDFAKGPWAEFIGRAGDPAQLRQLFDALLVSFGTHCCGDDIRAKINAVPIDDGTALRVVNALLEAARVRNQRPTGDLLPLERLVFHTNADLRAGVLRLVGYWKPAPGLDWLRGVFDENALDAGSATAAIESARDIGGAPAVELLKKLAAPAKSAPLRQRAAVALAALDAKAPEIAAALAASPNEDAALATWRDLFKTPKAIDALAAQLPADLPKPVAIAGVRAAREAGKKGDALLAALTPLAGNVPKPAPGAADFKGIAARMWTQGGDAAQGELIYRRANLGCVTCHAIGGAGGIVGPSLTSLGASAPADYIIESMLVPNAKVKEGYNGVTFKLKDGSEVMGIQARETASEVILRNVAGQESAVPKANITGKTDIGSIMPAGLLDALNDNERMNLYCFLAELGKPGPFDASKSQVARVWTLYPGTATDAALKGAPSDASANAFTLVDGRLTKAQLTEALQLVTNPGAVIYAVTQFQSTGKTRLELTGIAKVFLDGQPLTVTGDLAPELPAGVHTLAVKLDVPALPEVLRAASADATFVTN